MRILVNDIAASKSGALEILFQVYRYAETHSEDDEWIFFVGGDYLEDKANIKIIRFPEVKNSKLQKLQFDLWKGKRVIEKYKPDVVISLQNIVTFGLKIPQYVYIHQSIPYQDVKRFSFLKKEERKYAVYQYVIGTLINLSAKIADGIIVQTEWMKDAVSKKARINKEKIEVCLPDVELIEPEGMAIYKKNEFFYPTSIAIYKNNEIIEKACEILNAKGINDFKVYLTLPERTISQKNIACIGYLPKERVYQYYQEANLIFPSYIETIGLPLIESRSVGGIILAAKCPYAENVLLNYSRVLYFDPFNAKDLADLMERVMREETPRYQVTIERKVESEWGKAFIFVKSR